MSSIVSVFTFTWIYVRRYWVRLALSFLFGMVFALSNGSFIWAAKTLVGRFDVDSTAAAKPIKPSSFPAAPQLKEVNERFKDLGQQIERTVDPWLPRKGQPIGWRQIVGGLFFLPLLVAVRAGSDYLNNYCIGWVSERVIRDVRLDLMTRLSALSLDFFSRFKTGDLLTRINMDSHNLLRSLRVGAADLIKESLTAVVVFGGLCLLDPLLTLCTLILVPLLLFPLFVLGKKARRATKASLKANVRQSSQLVELLASIRVVKAFGLEGEQLARFRKTSGQIVHAGMKGVQAKELVNPLIEVVAVMGLGLLLLYVFQSGHSGAHLAAFLTGVLFLLQPVKKLAGLHILFEQAGVGTARLKELMSERPSVKEAVTPKPVAAFNNDIKFENVTFGFGDKVVLQDFSLTIPRGFRVGLAGESGCGKTTILNLLYRFYDPAAGTVSLDGIDLRDLSMDELRGQMALVSQEIVIFDQTIAENIACGKCGATRDEVEIAARAAFAHDFILKLPQGYDTQVGERGANLSGGQRQRISIARAFVRNAPILVLDEATAALDSKAEAEVQADIDRLAENRTVICVAHRLSTLASMDRIVVLAEGRIIESGGFDELLRAGGVFSGMAARQGIFLGRGK
jgi:ATP-binding cassette, subfamily B, bacterial MsbA